MSCWRRSHHLFSRFQEKNRCINIFCSPRRGIWAFVQDCSLRNWNRKLPPKMKPAKIRAIRKYGDIWFTCIAALPSAQIYPRWGAKLSRPYPIRVWPFSVPGAGSGIVWNTHKSSKLVHDGEPYSKNGTILRKSPIFSTTIASLPLKDTMYSFSF